MFHKGSTATTHLDSLGVHLVPLVRLGPVQSRVPLLADEQVGEVDLLKLELDRLDKLGCDKFGSFGSCKWAGFSSW
jgi:hypothetical protein